MSNLKEIIKSPHVKIALATGISIIVMAYVSKRLLPEPMSKLSQAIPPFLMVIYESLLSKYKDRKICTTWYWGVAIFGMTALVILFHLI